MLVTRPGNSLSKNLIGLGLISLLLTGCPVDEKFIFFPSAAIDETPKHFGVD